MDYRDQPATVNHVARVAQRLKRDGLLKRRAWVFPLARQKHWTAAVVNFPSKQVFFVDSLQSLRPQFVARVWTVLEVVSQTLRREPFNFSGWRHGSLGRKSPRQPDYFNCGIFPILLARCLHHGVQITRGWSQEDLDEQHNLIRIGASGRPSALVQNMSTA